MTDIRRRAVNGLKKGDFFTVRRTITANDVGVFARVSGDYNPVHFNETFAGQKNFDGCICHGLLVASLLTEIGGQIGWLASGMNLKFRLPVYIGETVRCDFVIADIDDRGRARAEITIKNEQNSVVLEAEIRGVLPNAREREIMKVMLDENETASR